MGFFIQDDYTRKNFFKHWIRIGNCCSFHAQPPFGIFSKGTKPKGSERLLAALLGPAFSCEIEQEYNGCMKKREKSFRNFPKANATKSQS